MKFRPKTTKSNIVGFYIDVDIDIPATENIDEDNIINDLIGQRSADAVEDELSDDDEADNTRMNVISNQRVTTCINDVRQFCEQNTGGSEFFNVLDKLEKFVTRVQFSAAKAGVQRDIASYFKKC
ncbi:hypothetical protein DPMN_133824 [Dreissena polymorpha]|uniref:Uncharacterized protein n=1 Tax=Dreissena polymorpha TaxID=45954 RepID=A0A9D4JBD0_DREPO|nr:hypothetical protein DPMN_133824 [Dreissena polymorpha]